MAAGLARPETRAQRGDGLRSTRLSRDLRQIAELIEICFAESMDTVGHSAVQEMKFAAQLGPILWLMGLLDWFGAGLGMGYVWRANGRVVGNSSLYRAGAHPRLGPGWMIANVAVHPDWRRRGIAREMMKATLDLTRRHHGGWVALQVDTQNAGAQELYRQLGFEAFENLVQWEISSYQADPSPPATSVWQAHPRRFDEVSAELDLILSRARRGAMAWTQPIQRDDVGGWLSGLESALGGYLKEHWALSDPANPRRLLGVLWAEATGWRRVRLNLFLDPALDDPSGRQALLLHALSRPSFQGWSFRVETLADDGPVDALLGGLGFTPVRRLTQMRALLPAGQMRGWD